MDKVEVPRAEADCGVVMLCDQVEARRKELDGIENRFLVLACAAFICLCGCSAIVQGKDAELVRKFGELASVVSFVGLPLFTGWFIRDRLRRKAIGREQTVTREQLEGRGYEYYPGQNARIYRLSRPS